jgi:hypothetical protein
MNLQKGYMNIPNEFFDMVARIRICGEARHVFDFIIKKTWGW